MAEPAPPPQQPEAAYGLKEAAEDLVRGKALIASDPEEAASILSKVLEVRVQAHGDFAEECAEPCLHYGRALLENLRATSDAMGSNKLRRNVKAALRAQQEADDEAEEKREREDAADTGNGNGAGPSSAPAAAAPTEDDGKPIGAAEGKEGSVEANEKQGASGSEDDADVASDEGEEEEGDDEGEEEDNDEEGEGEEGDEIRLFEGDLQLAWETLDQARIICIKHGEDKHRLLLADVHLALGDLAAEKQDLDDALAEYARCTQLLQAHTPPLQRRLAEAHFQTMLVQLAKEDLGEALKSCKAAANQLRARKDEVVRVLDTPVEGESAEDADEAIEALEEEMEELEGALADLKEHEDELSGAMKEERTLRSAITAAYKQIAEQVGEGSGSGSGSGPSAVQPSAIGVTGAAGPSGGGAGGGVSGAAGELKGVLPGAASAAAAVVQNLGVAGMGRKRITLQPATIAASAVAKPAEPASGATPGGGALPGSSSTTDPVVASSGKRTLEQLMAGGGGDGVSVAGLGPGDSRKNGSHKCGAAAAPTTTDEPAAKRAAGTAQACTPAAAAGDAAVPSVTAPTSSETENSAPAL